MIYVIDFYHTLPLVFEGPELLPDAETWFREHFSDWNPQVLCTHSEFTLRQNLARELPKHGFTQPHKIVLTTEGRAVEMPHIPSPDLNTRPTNQLNLHP